METQIGRLQKIERPSDGSGYGEKLDWIFGFFNAIIFCACVVALKKIDISGADLDRDGLTTITYSACRALLSVQLLAVCSALGAWILQRLNDKGLGPQEGDLSFEIASFFLGSSILGLIGTAIGLMGLLRLPVVLVLILPLVFLSPSYLVPYLRDFLRKARAAPVGKDTLWLTLNGLLASCLLIVAALSLLWKGLYPASAEADVWEHYIPYYREVLSTGSVAPGEVWVQYWASKAAGLFHLMGVVSDEFAAQFVSWVLIAMTTVIIVDLLKSRLKSTSWALLGAIVFLSAVLADPSFGAFIRHHAAVTAYSGFLIWAAVKMLEPPSAHWKAVRASALIVQFYAGLYLAQVVPLFAAFLGTLVLLGAVTPRYRPAVMPLAGLLLATILGMLTEFSVSYASTGVASLVSARLFWWFSDQEKFKNLVGTSGILYLLYTNNDNPPLSDAWLWLSRVFRLHQFLPLFVGALALLAVTALASLKRENRVSAHQKRDHTILVAAVAFLLVSLVPPFVFRNDSTVRLYIFVDLLVPILLLPILKSVVDVLKESLVKRIVVGTFLVGASVAMVYVGLSGFAYHLAASMSYVSGQLSTAEAMRRTADTVSEPERFGFMQVVRRGLGPEPRILALTYAPGPAGSFPARGLMSEPLHGLGPRNLEIVFGTPDQAADLLHREGIDYFHLSLGGQLFTGVAFSNLFRADHLQDRFRIAYRQGSQFLLTWRGPSDLEPLPDELAETLELKQKAVFIHPFERAFFEELKSSVSTALKKVDYCEQDSHGLGRDSTCLVGMELSTATTDVLSVGMPSEHLLPQNKQSVQGAFEEIERGFAPGVPAGISKVISETAAQKHLEQGVLTDRLTSELVAIVQIAVMNACLKRYDRPFCDLLTHRDERVPFGMIYRNRDSVSKILGLDIGH